MSIKRLRSRLHSNFTDTVLADINRVCMNRTISNNNDKADMILSVLDRHGIDYAELGPGTNRLAILIDNYVYKIALDPQGKRDNINEFKISKELQPYVVKTYETNDLISIHEYVTVISREEFKDQADDIRRILAILAETYLLGDVGAKEKNFCNWGFRDDGKLVILDFAHIYRINPDQIVCQTDQAILEYDRDYHDMICPKCARKYPFMSVRRLISLEQETQENIIARELSYKLTGPIEEIKEEQINAGYNGNSFTELPSRYNIHSDEEETKEDEDTMSHREESRYDREDHDQSYDDTLELVMRELKYGTPVPAADVITVKEEEQVVQKGSTVVTTTKSETNIDTSDEKSQIRIYKQVTETTAAATSVEVREIEAELNERDEAAIQEKALEELQNIQKLQEESERFIEEASEAEVITTEGSEADGEANVVIITRTEETVIVDGQVVDSTENVRLEIKAAEDEQASALAAELMDDSDQPDPYAHLHEQADQDRIDSANRNKRGGRNQWE